MHEDVETLRQTLGTMYDTQRFTEASAALARLAARLEATEAVVSAARPFAGQPGVRLNGPFEVAWLDLRAALAALDKETP